MFPFSWLLKLQNRFITWVRYYICFCRTAAFLSGLLISHKLVDLAVVGVLITYFSDSEYSKVFTLQKAAIFTSIRMEYQQLLQLLPLGFRFMPSVLSESLYFQLSPTSSHWGYCSIQRPEKFQKPNLCYST